MSLSDVRWMKLQIPSKTADKNPPRPCLAELAWSRAAGDSSSGGWRRGDGYLHACCGSMLQGVSSGLNAAAHARQAVQGVAATKITTPSPRQEPDKPPSHTCAGRLFLSPQLSIPFFLIRSSPPNTGRRQIARPFTSKQPRVVRGQSDTAVS
jgi:hypothetical protein